MKKTSLFLTMAATLWFQSHAMAEPTLTIGGVIEVEASSDEDTSDIAVATVEVGLAAQLNEKVSAEIVLLHEEGETDISVDTATVSLAFTDNLSVTAGKTYLPFGVFDSTMVSDPMTLELAETNASALQTDITTGPMTASLYTFNGVNTEEDIDNWGITLAYTSEHVAAALGYLANIGDTDTIAAETIKSEVPGISVSAAINISNFSFIAEYISASDKFQIGDGNADYQFTTRTKPSATNVELAYTMDATTLAVGVQNTEEAEVLGLPEKRTLATVSHELMENTTVALEWSSDEDYAGESSDTVTAQLAVEF